MAVNMFFLLKCVQLLGFLNVRMVTDTFCAFPCKRESCVCMIAVEF